MIPPLPTLATETILIVDAMPMVLEAVSLILKKAGFTVLSASSPEEAIQVSLDSPTSHRHNDAWDVGTRSCEQTH